MQSTEEKVEAIASLLPYLWIHLDFVPMRLKVSRSGEATGASGPGVVWRGLDCDGVCAACEWARACRGREWWQVVQERWRRRYRLRAIAVSLSKLYREMPQAWRAVVAVYVDPYDEASEPIDRRHRERRLQWAQKGLEWMANEIHGDVVGYMEYPRPKCILIRDMLAAGYTYKRIARDLHVSEREIRTVKREMAGTLTEYAASALG